MSILKYAKKIPGTQDLNDEASDLCSGGKISIGVPNPDIILYEREEFQGRRLRVRASLGHGIPNLQRFGSITSSFRIHQGNWAFYMRKNYRGKVLVLGRGAFPYNVLLGVTLKSLRRIKSSD